jgi:hypothetical protein
MLSEATETEDDAYRGGSGGACPHPSLFSLRPISKVPGCTEPAFTLFQTQVQAYKQLSWCRKFHLLTKREISKFRYVHSQILLSGFIFMRYL